MISNKFSHLIVLGACIITAACSAPANERGIASVSNDSTASGSAYNTNDGFAPAAPKKVTAVSVASTPTAVPSADSAAISPAPVATPVNPGTATTASVAATTPATKPAVKPAAADDSADIKRGEALISKSDCFACHKVDAKVLGPSYKDVAAKYANNAATINQLVEKVKKGGSGVWGAIPMSPHAALSDDDCKAMVKYILSLK